MCTIFSFKSKKTEVEHLHCKATIIEKPAFGFMKSIANGCGRVSIVRGLCLASALLVSILDLVSSKEEVVGTVR